MIVSVKHVKIQVISIPIQMGGPMQQPQMSMQGHPMQGAMGPGGHMNPQAGMHIGQQQQMMQQQQQMMQPMHQAPHYGGGDGYGMPSTSMQVRY